MECLVKYGYNAEGSDELTIKKGDILTDVTKDDGWWWEGTLRGVTGIFPANFVKIIEKPGRPSRRVIKRATVGKQLARCVLPYRAKRKDELSLTVGDIVTVISKNCEDKGWWSGELRGKIGFFPDNVVTIIAHKKVHSEVNTQPQPKITTPEKTSQSSQITVAPLLEELADNDDSIEVSVGSSPSNAQDDAQVEEEDDAQVENEDDAQVENEDDAQVENEDDAQVENEDELVSESVNNMSNQTTKPESGNVSITINLPQQKGDSASNSNSILELATLLGEISTRIMSLEDGQGALRKQLKVLLKRTL